MLQRIAINTPLPCYAKEFSQTDAGCSACEHGTNCRSDLGRRASRVTLDKAVFDLVPTGLQDFKLSDPEAESLADLYELCYETVFHTRGDAILRIKDAQARIIEASNEAHCSLRLYILTNMIGYHEASPDRKFYATMLFGDRASRRLELYRSVCRQKYGTFDIEAIDTLLGKETSDAESQMLNSEIIAGGFIVGFKIRSSGDPGPMLYAMQELSLSPLWLATDPGYTKDVLVRHISEPSGTSMIKRHRFSACQTLKELKRDHKRALHIFKTREKIMAQAVVSVLNSHGLSPQDFEIENVVKDASDFWRRLGYAIQHYWLLQYYQTGNPAFLNKVI